MDHLDNTATRSKELETTNRPIETKSRTDWYLKWKPWKYVNIILESLFGDTGKQLITVSDEIGSDMDKTKSREKYINQQLESLITELRTSHDKLAQAKVLSHDDDLMLRYKGNFMF